MPISYFILITNSEEDILYEVPEDMLAKAICESGIDLSLVEQKGVKEWISKHHDKIREISIDEILVDFVVK